MARTIPERKLFTRARYSYIWRKETVGKTAEVISDLISRHTRRKNEKDSQLKFLLVKYVKMISALVSVTLTVLQIYHMKRDCRKDTKIISLMRVSRRFSRARKSRENYS